MPDNQRNVTELDTGKFTTAPLLLLKLMGDLAVLEQELRNAEDIMGQPVSTYRDPLAERLCRVGVSARMVEDFIAWRRTISALLADESGPESRLAQIIAAESAGLALFAELISSMKSSEHHGALAA